MMPMHNCRELAMFNCILLKFWERHVCTAESKLETLYYLVLQCARITTIPENASGL